MTDYKVSLTTKLKPPQSGVIVIEPEDYTLAEIRALKKYATVLAYLSIGSVSDERPYYKDLKAYTLKKLDDWPHERYLDLRQAPARDWCQKQAKLLKAAGFDGFWLDNVDVYEEYRSTDMFNGVLSTIHAIKAVGGYVMVNGGKTFLTDMLVPHKVQIGAYKDKKNADKVIKNLKKKGIKGTIVEMDDLYKVQTGAFSLLAGADSAVGSLHIAGFPSAKRVSLFSGKPAAYVNGVTQEEVFSLITDYSGSGKFGSQTREESERYQSHMRRVVKAGIEGFLLEYTKSNTLKLRIKAFCATAGIAGCCISDTVDL